MIKKLIRYAGLFLSALLLLLIFFLSVLYFTADMKQPDMPENLPAYTLIETDSLRTFGPNRLYQSKSGLWELSVSGTAVERGYASGMLMKDLLYYQEKVFVDQIRQIVPSDSYLKFLRFALILFNRNLGAYVPEEYRKEIYAISLSCTHEYDAIGSPYERQLNYHAAHDIGHAMQDYMLVGCSSFGVWGAQSADSSLLIGRNFDFYVGDDFARNKLVTFCYPDTGYRFASVGWAGMIGVLSGMNEAGLTVTLNAAKSTMPVSAATPISILARMILQYASTIDEAYEIAKVHKTFVAESLLIGSAKDGQAAIIEKSTDRIALFSPEGERVVCTNHYQSDAFSRDERNLENIATSDSPYRYARLEELLDENSPVDAPKAASILRNRFGRGGRNIGMANEKAVNQFIAHHSVIFKPEEQMMWVSTSPWQIGAYVAYDLKKIFAVQGDIKGVPVDSLTIPADPFLESPAYQYLLIYRKYTAIIRRSIDTRIPLDESFIVRYTTSNPEMYYVWQLVGDYYKIFGKQDQAISCWKKALTKEIPKEDERIALEKRINSK